MATDERLDYVKYDTKSQKVQSDFKEKFSVLIKLIESEISCLRSRALAITRIEESYMWVGKGIRNDQILRDSSTELQEERRDDADKISDL